MRVISCVKCGVSVEARGVNQKYCPSCAREAKLEWHREHDYEMKQRRKIREKAKRRETKLCQWKPDTRGIGECKRWRECRYGAECDYNVMHFGSCNYLGITGRCKVVRTDDGKATVEPTKNCRFFEPREEEE